MNAVASGFRADINYRTADAAGSGVEDAVGIGQAYRHGID